MIRFNSSVFYFRTLKRHFHFDNFNMGPVEENIRTKLETAFKPHVLQIFNESNKHNVPKGSETHFKIVVVSDYFDGKPLIERHRQINEVLKDNLSGGVHALSITARTLKQWEETNATVAKSPPCLGGSGL